MYIHKGEYDHKKGNKPKVYFIEYDSGLVQNALKSVRDWREAEVTKKLGYRVCHSMDSWQAKKCPFYSVCYERNIDEVVERIYSEKEVENNGSNS